MKILLSLTFLFLIQIIDFVKLKNDPILKEYKKTQNLILDGLNSKKYKLPTNLTELKEKPTKENMIKVYKEGGMSNAEEYVDLIQKQNKLMFVFIKNHPELLKLDQKKQMEIFIKLLED